MGRVGVTDSPQLHNGAEEPSSLLLQFKSKRTSLEVPYKKIALVSFSFALFLVLNYVHIFHRENEKAQSAFALLIMLVILWVSEIIPLWCTSMLAPFFVILFNIVEVPETSSDSLSKFVLKDLASPTVVLVLGGFSLALALHKYHLDLQLAMLVLSKTAHSFPLFLFVLILLGAFLSMWISNVVAPALCAFLVTPMLKKSDKKTGKCVAMAIAFSCNVGGMLTPIASPQNEVAVEILEDYDYEVGFGKWMLVVIPICTLFLVAIWGFLLWWFKPSGDCLNIEVIETGKWTWEHYYVIFIVFLTVILWCTYKTCEDFWGGDLGTIGIIPIIAFFGSGILSSQDLDSIDWGIVLLVMGGEIVGLAVKDSKLLHLASREIEKAVDGESIWLHYFVFSGSLLVITNFISHTVGAFTMLPVVAEVGKDHCRMMVVGGVLCVSSACMLPVSSFPNIMAHSMKDVNGKPYLDNMDFLKCGICVEIIELAIMASWGWAIFTWWGF